MDGSAVPGARRRPYRSCRGPHTRAGRADQGGVRQVWRLERHQEHLRLRRRAEEDAGGKPLVCTAVRMILGVCVCIISYRVQATRVARLVHVRESVGVRSLPGLVVLVHVMEIRVRFTPYGMRCTFCRALQI